MFIQFFFNFFQKNISMTSQQFFNTKTIMFASMKTITNESQPENVKEKQN